MLKIEKIEKCVNLPRWGLKRSKIWTFWALIVCKFTPLGFETKNNKPQYNFHAQCKFTPLGFETLKYFELMI